MEERERRCWVVVASRDHVRLGVAGGFMQANHGKAAPLRRMHPGDGVVFYSPKLAFGGNEACQRFTAIGEVAAGEVVQVDMGGGFTPFRRAVAFRPGREAPIQPLVERLDFIANKRAWGAPFRFGVVRISTEDFDLIAAAMAE